MRKAKNSRSGAAPVFGRFAKHAMESQKDKLDAAAQANVQEVLQLLDQNVAKINEQGKRAYNTVNEILLHSRGEAGGTRHGLGIVDQL